MDGMGIENSFGNSSYQINSAAVQEMVLQTTGVSADTNADGAVVNVIPKGGRQHVQRHRGRLLRQRQHGEPEPHARAARSRSRHVELDVEDVGPVAEPGRADHARPAVVLPGRAELGLLAAARRGLLEPEHLPGRPAHRPAAVPHPAGGRAEGRQLHPVHGHAGQPLQRAAGVVRLVPEPHHLAGGGQPQVQLHLRRAARLQLRLHQRQPDAGVGARLPLRPEPPDAVHVDVDADEPPAARGRRHDRDLAVEHLPDAGASNRTKC